MARSPMMVYSSEEQSQGGLKDDDKSFLYHLIESQRLPQAQEAYKIR